MGKEINYNMGKTIFEMASKPFRSKQEVILLLLYTIRTFDVENDIQTNTKVKVIISISKMNRIFYILENKIFSVQFPFCVEVEGEKLTRIYDAKTGLDIDTILLSMLIGIFEKTKNDNFSFEFFFDEVMYNENNLLNVNVDQLWEIVKFISTYDLGYLRYDYDQEHKNGLLHPINHLDVCLDTAAAYKIGLEKPLNYEMFKDILDITTNCYFLKL